MTQTQTGHAKQYMSKIGKNTRKNIYIYKFFEKNITNIALKRGQNGCLLYLWHRLCTKINFITK